MPSESPKRWALITGCGNATGLGIELAKLLIESGWGVYATARTEGKLTDAKEVGCIPLELDVTKPESIRAAADRVSKETGGKLHCLVNNAGVFGRGLTLDADINKYKHVFDVNFFGPLMMAQAFAPLLVRAGLTGGPKPCIMNIGSTCETGSPHVSAYSTSKAASRALSTALRVETAGLGLSVVHVILGSVSSGGHDEFSLGEGVTNMRRDAPDAASWTTMANPVDATESVYRECRDDVWKAEMATTKIYHGATTDTPQSVAKSLLKAINTGGPAYLHLAYQGWQTKYIVPWLPTSVLDGQVINLCGLDKIHPNSDAAEM